MDKITLTRKQADALNSAIRKYGKDNVLDDYLLYLKTNNQKEEYALLNELKPSVLAKALYIGYKTDLVVEVGNRVKFFDTKGLQRIGVVEVVIPNDVRVNYFDRNGEIKIKWLSKDSLIKATLEESEEEKERRLFNKYNRKYWELKDRDLLIDSAGTIVTAWVDLGKVYLTKDGDTTLSVLHPEQLKGLFEIVCFAENRLDVKKQ